jgi:hypothetical protein
MLIATTIWVTAAPHIRTGFAVNLHIASSIYSAVGTEELREAKEGFAERCKNSGTALALPKSDSDIDFSNIQFDRGVAFLDISSSPPKR